MSDHSGPKTMKIYLNQIKEEGQSVELDGEMAWLRQTAELLDESPGMEGRHLSGHLDVRRVDEVFLMTGNVKMELNLVCSRCATPFRQEVHPRFTALYSRDPVYAGLGPDAPESRGKASHHQEPKAGVPAPNGESADPELDIAYLEEDHIDLGAAISEQVRLNLPLQPLCSKDCRGLCSGCGVDLNQESCHCEAERSESPFAALKGMRIPAGGKNRAH